LHLQRVWGEQEGMLADFLERREIEGRAKSGKRGPRRPAPKIAR